MRKSAPAPGDVCSPSLRLLLDETANIAPLADLPQQLSEAGSQGIRFATVWQSLGQMRDRYHDATDAVLAASTAKLFMGPVSDEATRRYVCGALGEELRQHDEYAFWRPKAGPAELQQLDRAGRFIGRSAPDTSHQRGRSFDGASLWCRLGPACESPCVGRPALQLRGPCAFDLRRGRSRSAPVAPDPAQPRRRRNRSRAVEITISRATGSRACGIAVVAIQLEPAS